MQVVAVKIFTDQVPGDNQLRYAEAFRREIFILRSCHDRNIVQFLGACLQVWSHLPRHAMREGLAESHTGCMLCPWVCAALLCLDQQHVKAFLHPRHQCSIEGEVHA